MIINWDLLNNDGQNIGVFDASKSNYSYIGNQSLVNIQFQDSATSEFLNLQSGNASPFFYIEAIISGNTAIIGTSFTSTNWLIDGGTISREKPILPGDRSSIFSSDVTLKVDNTQNRFSPLHTSSIFYNNQYINSQFNYWAGFLNASGTAILIQRGAFLLQNLTIDTRESIASLRLVDKFKKVLDTRIGTYDVSGTAIQLTFTGSRNSQDIITSLLLTSAGLTAGDISIQNGLGSFNSLSLSDQSVAEAIALVSEASDGYMYTSRKGLLTFISNAPTFGFMSLADFTATDSGHYANLRYEEDFQDRVNKIVFDYSSGTSLSIIAQTLSNTGNTVKLSNDAISTIGDAQAITTRFLDRFSGTTTKLTIDSVWIPSLEIGNKINIINNNAAISGLVYELYKLEEEPTNNIMTLYLINNKAAGKWGYVSDNSAVVCGTIFTGGASELNGWQAGWAFAGRDTGTATNPGFDADGNNNNVINANITSSGVGGTGIELLFQAY